MKKPYRVVCCAEFRSSRIYLSTPEQAIRQSKDPLEDGMSRLSVGRKLLDEKAERSVFEKKYIQNSQVCIDERISFRCTFNYQIEFLVSAEFLSEVNTVANELVETLAINMPPMGGGTLLSISITPTTKEEVYELFSLAPHDHIYGLEKIQSGVFGVRPVNMRSRM